MRSLFMFFTFLAGLICVVFGIFGINKGLKAKEKVDLKSYFAFKSNLLTSSIVCLLVGVILLGGWIQKKQAADRKARMDAIDKSMTSERNSLQKLLDAF